MLFHQTKLPGAFLIEPERMADERGFFARTWCRGEFAERGLSTELAQCSISYNAQKGTLRGMHYQAPPHEEVRLVRCTRGAIYDVIIDLRPDSPTHQQWFATELTADNRRMLYVPQGFAHGFQTLVDDTEIFYQISDFYAPDSVRGVRWNDPTIRIDWPLREMIMSHRDAALPTLQVVNTASAR